MPTIFEEEYWHARNLGSSHLEATHRAIDYIRRFTNRELTFFTDEDYKSVDRPVDANSTSTDMVNKVLNELDSDKEISLFITLVKMTGLDMTVGPEPFLKYEAYNQINVDEICPECEGEGKTVDQLFDAKPDDAVAPACLHCNGAGILPPKPFTHKRAASLAGFPTKDNAMKSYHVALGKIRRLLDKMGHNPLRPGATPRYNAASLLEDEVPKGPA